MSLFSSLHSLTLLYFELNALISIRIQWIINIDFLKDDKIYEKWKHPQGIWGECFHVNTDILVYFPNFIPADIVKSLSWRFVGAFCNFVFKFQTHSSVNQFYKPSKIWITSGAVVNLCLAASMDGWSWVWILGSLLGTTASACTAWWY